MLRSALAALVLLVAPAAVAGTCPPYPHAEWKAAMDGVDEQLAALRLREAREALGEVQQRVRCVEGIARPDHLGRFGRQVAMVFFFDQDLEAMRRWALIARTAAPDLPWPAGLSEHPFRAAVDALEVPAAGGPADRYLAVEKKGGVFANGHAISLPRAVPEVPTLIQVTDKRGSIVRAYWQDGAAFPPAMLTADGGPLPAPRWWAGPPPTDPSVVGSALAFQVPERPPLPAADAPVEPSSEPPVEDPPVDALPAEPAPEETVEFEYVE